MTSRGPELVTTYLRSAGQGIYPKPVCDPIVAYKIPSAALIEEDVMERTLGNDRNRRQCLALMLLVLTAYAAGDACADDPNATTPKPPPAQPTSDPPPKSDAVRTVESSRSLHSLNPCNAKPAPAWCPKSQ
jgi:hypothetical protein